MEISQRRLIEGEPLGGEAESEVLTHPLGRGGTIEQEKERTKRVR
jgi:hypothetical protein